MYCIRKYCSIVDDTTGISLRTCTVPCRLYTQYCCRQDPYKISTADVTILGGGCYVVLGVWRMGFMHVRKSAARSHFAPQTDQRPTRSPISKDFLWKLDFVMKEKSCDRNLVSNTT
jgi:hypothetical protein